MAGVLKARARSEHIQPCESARILLYFTKRTAMEKMQRLLKQINEATLQLQRDYPEVHSYLDENPLTISAGTSPELSSELLNNYLESLRELLRRRRSLPL